MSLIRLGATEEDQAVADAVARFAEETLAPVAQAMDEEAFSATRHVPGPPKRSGRFMPITHSAAGLEGIGKGAGYAQRQIEGWSKRYRDARTWNVPRGDRIMRWLAANLPAQERICITHNDFRFDNVVLDPDDPTRIIGVLDWELATLGDPLMDLGNTLAYWVEAGDDFMAQGMRRQPTHLPGMLTRREVIAYYCGKMGFDAGDFSFHEVYGLFRLSAIAQQIYYRYHHGQSRNPAFKRFWLFVNYLHWRCRRAIARGARR